MFIIEFSPPANNIEGRFNTVRLGGTWANRLKDGDSVLLSLKSELIGTAVVEHVEKGRLLAIAEQHAKHNHNQRILGEEGAPQRLIDAMVKRYGPHKVSHTSLVSVIYLRLKP